MAKTTVELYRAGNKTSAKFAQLRPGEVTIYNHPGGVDLVAGRSGGASTLEQPIGARGTWWRLPAGTDYDDSLLFILNDYPGHWEWQPARTMVLADYANALEAVNVKFIRV